MDGDSGLEAGLRTSLPAELEARSASALFLHGWALAGERPVRDLQLIVDGEPTPALAHRMPSPRVAAELGRDTPEARHCIFWGVAVLPTREPGSAVSVGLRARTGREWLSASLGEIAVAAGPEPVGLARAPEVAICMATHEPPPQLLAEQLDSLRSQTHGNWICLISDDASSPERFAELERLVGDDDRFVVSRWERRLGAYRNFARALAMVPPEIPYVALCDQDDRWHPDKLATLAAAIGEALLVFSDMRIVDRSGAVTSPTYWTARRPNHERFASLLLGNTVTGAASLFRRELLDDALPLPPPVGNLYHDHWLALVARARGPIAYVPRALYDYVQHPGAVVGHADANLGVVGGGVLSRLRALRGRERGRLRDSWRRIYFGEYMRLRLCARALEARLGRRIGGSERRALRLVESGAWAAPWLALRQVRRLWHDETQGSEAAMLRALAWELAMRARRGRGDPTDDADVPSDEAPGRPLRENPPG
jgi:glycosyltransferase involved in cell wall biosynthesis